MNFGLSEEQKLLETSVADMFSAELSTERLRDIVYEGSDDAATLWSQLVDSGIASMLVPESAGGAGLQLLDATLVFEQAGRVALPLPLFGHTLATLCLARAAESVETGDTLAALAGGQSIATCGFQLAPGYYETDRYEWVEFADRADSAILVSANEVRLHQIHAGALEAARGTDLTRPCWHLEAVSGGVSLPVSPEFITGAARILLAADSYGIGKHMISTATDYALTRKQFGRLIGEFQSVKHPLAELASQLEFSRSLIWQASIAWQNEEPGWESWSLLAKAHVTELVTTIARQCVFSMGAIGFAWESDMHLWLKRALFNSVHLGTPQTQRRQLARLKNW